MDTTRESKKDRRPKVYNFRFLTPAREPTLLDRYLAEIARIPQDDILMRTRIKYKYRLLGLNI